MFCQAPAATWAWVFLQRQKIPKSWSYKLPSSPLNPKTKRQSPSKPKTQTKRSLKLPEQQIPENKFHEWTTIASHELLNCWVCIGEREGRDGGKRVQGTVLSQCVSVIRKTRDRKEKVEKRNPSVEMPLANPNYQRMMRIEEPLPSFLPFFLPFFPFLSIPYPSTLANSTLIILFSEMLKISKIISSKSIFFYEG